MKIEESKNKLLQRIIEVWDKGPMSLIYDTLDELRIRVLQGYYPPWSEEWTKEEYVHILNKSLKYIDDVLAIAAFEKPGVFGLTDVRYLLSQYIKDIEEYEPPINTFSTITEKMLKYSFALDMYMGEDIIVIEVKDAERVAIEFAKDHVQAAMEAIAKDNLPLDYIESFYDLNDIK